jgi:hypothetical protein
MAAPNLLESAAPDSADERVISPIPEKPIPDM